MKKISFSPSFLLLLALAVSLVGVKVVQAVTTSIVSSAIRLERHRVSFTEVKNASSTSDPDGTCNGLAKRVVIDTIQAGGQLLSITSHANDAFVATTSTNEIHIQAIRAEQGGVQLSSGDIGMPNSSMTDPSYIENRIPVSNNYNFYDENNTWDVVAYFCGFDGGGHAVTLSNLTAGSADFYELVTK